MPAGATGHAASAVTLSAVRCAEAKPCTQHHNWKVDSAGFFLLRHGI